jgi:5'-nucleotidase
VALHDALRTVADVEVVAPEHNNSAKSNALTLNAPCMCTRRPTAFAT